MHAERHSPTPRSQAADAVPLDLKVNLAEQKIAIDWKDGTHSQLSLNELRRQCPCATCRTEREQRSKTLLPILRGNPSGDIRVVSAELVGSYAIQFTWSDGHNTGIFDFRFLKTLG